MQAGVTDDLQLHSSLISSQVCHISLAGSCLMSGWNLNWSQRKRLTVSGNLILASLACQVKENKQQCREVWIDAGDLQKDTDCCYTAAKLNVFWIPCQGFRLTPRGNKRAPNASLFYSRLDQPDLVLKANFWKQGLRNKTMLFFFFFNLYPFPFLLSPHIVGLTYKVKEVEKLTVLLQCLPGTEPYSMEDYRSGDVRENMRKGRNPTATSPSQFFRPLMIVMVRCRILHWHLYQNRHHI